MKYLLSNTFPQKTGVVIIVINVEIAARYYTNCKANTIYLIQINWIGLSTLIFIAG